MGRQILTLKKKGLSHSAIGSRLGLKKDTVTKTLARQGWRPATVVVVQEMDARAPRA